MTKAKRPREWDAEGIKAEIRRRGLNMTKIAIDAGLTEAACRKALFGLSRPGADAIAAALGIPFDELFPTGFVRSRNRRPDPYGNDRASESQKRTVASDTARASA